MAHDACVVSTGDVALPVCPCLRSGQPCSHTHVELRAAASCALSMCVGITRCICHSFHMSGPAPLNSPPWRTHLLVIGCVLGGELVVVCIAVVGGISIVPTPRPPRPSGHRNISQEVEDAGAVRHPTAWSAYHSPCAWAEIALYL
jgi:hypothetical protein